MARSWVGYMATGIAVAMSAIVGSTVGASSGGVPVPPDGGGGTPGSWVAPTKGKWERGYQHPDSDHFGVDISNGQGTPILAVHDGEVEQAQCTSPFCDRPGSIDLGGCGYTVKVKHPDGSATRYCHLVSMAVKKGDKVNGGRELGKMGSTGNSTGNHLHFEAYINNKTVDPEKYMMERGKIDLKKLPK